MKAQKISPVSRQKISFFSNMFDNDYLKNNKNNRPVLKIHTPESDTIIKFDLPANVAKGTGQLTPIIKRFNEHGITTKSHTVFRRNFSKIVPNHIDCYYGFVQDANWMYYGVFDAANHILFVAAVNLMDSTFTIEVAAREVAFNKNNVFTSKLDTAFVCDRKSVTDLKDNLIKNGIQIIDDQDTIAKLTAQLKKSEEEKMELIARNQEEVVRVKDLVAVVEAQQKINDQVLAQLANQQKINDKLFAQLNRMTKKVKAVSSQVEEIVENAGIKVPAPLPVGGSLDRFFVDGPVHVTDALDFESTVNDILDNAVSDRG
ncbi:hypothetical protein [Aeromonas rivipollensis]|uniref:hypothetical protein n=1 Tax=Aeromonas rivipollensis TaxID=948519 RepID=UPI003D1ECFB5